MKDYIVAPDRVVSIKGLDSAITTADGGLRIGAAAKIVDLAEHASARKLFPALVSAAEHVGTPQIRNMGTVGGNIMQRPRCWYFRNEEFNCLKKGGSRCFAVEGENQFHAIFGDGPCHIVHPSSLAVPVIAYGGPLPCRRDRTARARSMPANFSRCPTRISTARTCCSRTRS